MAKPNILYIREHVQTHKGRPFCVFLSWGPPHWSFLDTDRAYGEYSQEYNVYHPRTMDVPENVPRKFRDFAAKESADDYGMTTALMRVLAESWRRWTNGVSRKTPSSASAPIMAIT
jgi:hypothetical protein